MEEQFIFIYSFCDDLLASFGIINDAQCKMNSAEIMTVTIVAALFFGGNFSKARLIFLPPYKLAGKGCAVSGQHSRSSCTHSLYRPASHPSHYFMISSNGVEKA